jgi:hypothetical protein
MAHQYLERQIKEGERRKQMTAQELQKRNERAQTLRVIQVDHDSFYVESSEGKIAYKVTLDDESAECVCGDWIRNIKSDPNFRCKHIMSVINCLPDGEYDKAQFLEKRKPKLDERFIITLEGKDFVTYPGLLDLGHQKGILKIEVEPVQLPTKENEHMAVCKAIVTSKGGESFVDVGDANPANTNSRVSKHLLRMASTRAIARALRSMTNIGMTCLEELADYSDAIGNSTPKAQAKVKKLTPKATPQKEEKKETPPKAQPEEKPKAQSGGNGNGRPKKKEQEPAQAKEQAVKKEEPKPEVKELASNTVIPKMSEAQKRAVYNLSRRRGISVEALEKMTQEKYNASLDQLSAKDCSEFIRTLQQAA